MSFVLKRFAKIGASFNTDVGTMYKYDGIAPDVNDDLATIIADNYFLSRKTSLKLHDMIEIVATDKNGTFIITALEPDVSLGEFAEGQSDFITSVEATNLVVTSGDLNTVQNIDPTAVPEFATIKLSDLLAISAGAVVFVKINDGTIGVDASELFYDETKKGLAVGTTDVTLNVNGQEKEAGLVAATQTGADKFGLLSKYFGNTNTAAVTMAYARGNQAAPSTVSAGDTVSKMCTAGLKEAGIYGEVATIEVTAADDFAPSESPGILVFKTTNKSATTATPKMLLSDDGRLSVSSAIAHPAAQFEVSSTDKGMLLPRLTQVQIDAITPVVEGLMVFNSTTNEFNGLRNTGAGIVWVKFDTTDVP